MIKYLCNECGNDFESEDDPDVRKCPFCGSEAEDHIMRSLSEASDVKTFVGEGTVWEA